MIAQLRGTLAGRAKNHAVVDCNGVGYGVWVPERVLMALDGDRQVTFYTYMAVREDAIELFGFSTPQDREFFKLLISISGIGPKAALNILSFLDAASLTRAIANGDANRLVAVPGIGKKTAARLILELKEKVKQFAADAAAGDGTPDELADVLEVLENLGCDAQRAREAVEQVRVSAGDNLGFDALLAESLQLLGR
ncbi:MAG: Holliday junction branch migration protein RuvA [Armatimonadetes bacterium]|nr:Holliday junction branch migration protein RuvA [Armatimonadota bacterium]